jgi:hypothetical protein
VRRCGSGLTGSEGTTTAATTDSCFHRFSWNECPSYVAPRNNRHRRFRIDARIKSLKFFDRVRRGLVAELVEQLRRAVQRLVQRTVCNRPDVGHDGPRFKVAANQHRPQLIIASAVTNRRRDLPGRDSALRPRVELRQLWRQTPPYDAQYQPPAIRWPRGLGSFDHSDERNRD